MTEQTHFGYQQIPKTEKGHRVKQVFDSVANRYDLMNDLMSFGLHRLWKPAAVAACAVKPGHKVLDLAGGTGDLASQFVPLVGETGSVCIADINLAMLQQGKAKLLDRGIIKPVQYLQASAEQLPISSHSYDCVSIAFGLRNVTDQPAALAEMYRVLAPGGRVMILEFSKLTEPKLQPFYDAYSFGVIPVIGKLITQDSASYQYLVESIRKHPDQDTLLSMMEQAGFEQCSYRNLNAGIVAIHQGIKF